MEKGNALVRGERSQPAATQMLPSTHSTEKETPYRRENTDTVEDHPVCIYLIYYDIEKPDKTRAILCAEMDQYGQQFTFQGETCLVEFLAWIHDIG